MREVETKDEGKMKEKREGKRKGSGYLARRRERNM